ncbi:D-alanine--D-alanine ligase family protein [Agrococcus sp. TF02-05]|uniref:D-alanine--D-alanine ligase family protein n=1 Tax=Agrococcus sp. TF02-05 TaxID=2815211 RepID=UPI001AA13AA4|nr:D-alanine--D-alanine ligase family protein [Agrococcus sp. TF02-05]MBO1770841.1 D-alanine--D-alanine ligase [Agrococcus sp. TF02-05]
MAEGKTRVALLFGGRSSEHLISCATAGSVLAHIDRDRYDVVPIGIARDGRFVLQADDPAPLALERSPEVVGGDAVLMPTTSDSRTLTAVDAAGAIRELGDVDVVFPILHGRFGEDGTVQGMLDLIDIPYVGNGVLSSAVAMDKHFAKTVLEHVGIAVAPWMTVSRGEWRRDAEGVRARLADFPLPVFVKPARAGSSVGVTRVDAPADLDRAMELALAEDSRALVEVGIAGREIEVGVLGGRDGARPRASLPGEIVLDEGTYYDFDAKYRGTPTARTECPADLDEATVRELQETAVRAFEAIEGAGLARVDFFLSPEHGIVVNEINTMPGFTSISMFPVVWQASGIAYTDLITELIELGLGEER